MKKFFKALALVLALTLVIGCIPASAAEKKVKSSKVLYVGGAQGESADGTIKSALKGRVAIRKLAGYTAKEAKEHTFKAELVSGADIICGKKYVKATTLGKSVVAIYVDGEKVGETTITSKVNAANSEKGLVISGIEEGNVVVGKEYTISLPRANNDSDERRLFVNDVEVKEADPAKARVYKYTFDKVGEYTIKAEAFQSTKLNKTLVSKEIKVTAVKPAATKAVQSAGDTVTVYFDDDASVLTAADFDIYWENAAGAKIRDKVIKSATYNKDNNTVAITCYSAFTAKTEYNVAVGDTIVKFKGKSNTIADIDKFVIDTAQVLAGSLADVSFKFYDVDGMELKLASQPAMVIEKVNGSANSSVNGSKVFISKAGETIVIKAYYETYDANYNTEKHYCAEKTIVGVDQYTASEIVDYSITANADSIAYASSFNHEIKCQDANYFFHIKTQKTDNLTGAQSTDDLYKNGAYKLESVDEKVFVVQNDWEIKTIAAGVGTVILKKVSDNSVLAAFTITVKAAKYFNSFDISINKGNYNFNNAADSIKVSVIPYDQYGDKMQYDLSNIAFTIKGGAASISFSSKDWTYQSWDGTYVNNAKFDSEATLTEANKEVNVVFEAKAQQKGGSWGWITKNVAVTAAKITNTPNTFVLEGAKNYDTALTQFTKTDDIKASNTIKLAKYYNGYAVAEQDMEFAAEAPKTEAGTATFAAIYYYTITKDGNAVKTGSANVVTGSSLTIKPFQGLESGSLDNAKLGKGSYVVTAYKYENTDGKTNVATTLATTSFTVADNQAKATITQVKESIDHNTITDEKAIFANGAFTFAFNGKSGKVTDAGQTGLATTPDSITAAQDSTSKAWVFTEIKFTLSTGSSDGYAVGNTYTYTVAADGVPAVVK